MNNVNMMNAYPAAREQRISISASKGKSSFLIAEISASCNYLKLPRRDRMLCTENKILRSTRNGLPREAKWIFPRSRDVSQEDVRHGVE